MRDQFTVDEGLKGCPICGTAVSMTVRGKIIPDTPEYVLPLFVVRGTIRCPRDGLTLDPGREGFIEAGKSEEEQKELLNHLMRYHADEVRKLWNRRVETHEDRHSRFTTEPEMEDTRDELGAAR